MTDRATDSENGEGHPFGRRQFLRAWGVAGALTASGLTLPTVDAQEAEEVNRIWTNVLARLPDNWGRWGDDDEIGAVNLLDSEQVRRGLETAMPEDGETMQVFPLQLPYTGDVITGDDPTGDPVFPTRQPARRDNVIDARMYQQGGATPLRGGMKFADDAFITRLFLQGSSQYDALAHVWYDRPTEGSGERVPLLYNGFPAETTADRTEFSQSVPGLRPPDPMEEPFSTDLEEVDVTETFGPSRGDIIHVAEHGSVGRGVLLDVGRHMDSEHPTRLDPGQCVTLSDLQETAEAQGVEIQQRDVLLVRTGSTERALDPEGATWLGDPEEPVREPGLCFSQDLVEWLADKDIPIIGGDNLAVEKLTTAQISVQEDINQDIRSQVDFGGRETLNIVNPLHPAMITNLGITVVEILWLQDLAASAAQDGVYTFMYVGSPLKIVQGAGAPVNPTVIKASPAAQETTTPATETATATPADGTTTPADETTTPANETTTQAARRAAPERSASQNRRLGLGSLAALAGIGGAAAALGSDAEDDE